MRVVEGLFSIAKELCDCLGKENTMQKIIEKVGERESFVSPSKPANLLKMNPFISFQASLSVFWMTSVTFPTAAMVAKENEC